MKKKQLLITGFLLILGAGVLGFHPDASYTAVEFPRLNENTCQAAYENGASALSAGWRKNLTNMADQPGPTSNVVEDAIEDARTYGCWLQYLCNSVQFSALNFDGKLLSSDELGAVPGCTDAEDVELPQEEWKTFLDWLSASPDKSRVKLPSPTNKFLFIPQCSPQANTTTKVQFAAENFNQCQKYINQIYDPSSPSSNTSIILEKQLMQSANAKKTKILETKLQGIGLKLVEMTERGNLMKQYFIELESRIPCFLKQCT